MCVAMYVYACVYVLVPSWLVCAFVLCKYGGVYVFSSLELCQYPNCMYVEPTGPSSVFGCAVAQHQHHDEHTAVRVHLHVSYKVNNTDVLPDATDILPRYLVERKGESV